MAACKLANLEVSVKAAGVASLASVGCGKADCGCLYPPVWLSFDRFLLSNLSACVSNPSGPSGARPLDHVFGAATPTPAPRNMMAKSEQRDKKQHRT